MAGKKQARIVLRDDMVFTAFSSNSFTLPLDAKKEAGGHDAGISPMELMLVSLAGCTGMDVISIMRKKKQDVASFEVVVEGTRADAHPRVWNEIWVTFKLAGRNIDPAALERSIELSREKYCGAAATLRHTATMHYDYEITETETNETETD